MNTENKYQKSAVVGMWRMGATMEEMCGTTGIDANVIKRIIDGYKKETGINNPHSTTGGNSITCTSTENDLSSTV